MFNHKPDHVIINEPFLLLVRIHQRFFTYAVDYPGSPCRGLMDFIDGFACKYILGTSGIIHMALYVLLRFRTVKMGKRTMSEIIASVYDLMESSGVQEGILFLDEINCVSETLAPLMLQFLQYKVFGRHRVPGGWIVVTAGNPPEYNNSVREFDVVTLDRLKKIEVEPDLDV